MCSFLFYRCDRTDLASQGVYADEATHLLAASSIAYDRDLKYGPEDLARFFATTPFRGGPVGLFLKIAPDGRYYYGKPFLYAVYSAPWVAALGYRGPLYANAFALSLILFLCSFWLARTIPLPLALGLGLAFFALSPFYPYVLVIHPDVFYALLIVLAVFSLAWFSATGRRIGLIAGGAFSGLAVYEKLPFALLLACAGVALLVKRGYREFSIFLALALVAFAAVSSVHYFQDKTVSAYRGQRLYYPSVVPFTHGPADPGAPDLTRGTEEKVFSAGFILSGIAANLSGLPRQMLNLAVGRQTGTLIYFPFVLCLLVLIARGRVTLFEGSIVAGLVAYWVFLALVFPMNPYGGACSLGDRYTMQIIPALFMAVSGPARVRPMLLAVAGAVASIVACVFLGPIVASPDGQVKNSGLLITTSRLSMLPLEGALVEKISEIVGDPGFVLRADHEALYRASKVTRRDFNLFSGDAESLLLKSDGTEPKLFFSSHCPSTVRVRAASGFQTSLSLKDQETAELLIPRWATSYRAPGRNGWCDIYELAVSVAAVDCEGGPADDIRLEQPKPMPYSLGQEIDFSTSVSGSSAMTYGWHEREAWGTWSAGGLAELMLETTPAPSDLQLTVTVNALVTEKQPKVVVRVLSGNDEIATWTFTDASIQERLARIPKADWGTLATLRFRVWPHASPSSLGISSDERDLGIGVHRLRVDAVP